MKSLDCFCHFNESTRKIDYSVIYVVHYSRSSRLWSYSGMTKTATICQGILGSKKSAEEYVTQGKLRKIRKICIPLWLRDTFSMAGLLVMKKIK